MNDRMNFKLLPMSDRDKPCFFCKTRLSVKFLVILDDGQEVHVCNRCVLTVAKEELGD